MREKGMVRVKKTLIFLVMVLSILMFSSLAVCETYDNLTSGQIEKLVDKLGGMDGVSRALQDDNIIAVFPKALAAEIDDILGGYNKTLEAQVKQTSRYIETTYSLIVPERTLAEAIKVGNYEEVDPNINATNFPLTGEVYSKKDMAIFFFDKEISSEDVEKEMDAVGYRPADIVEGIVFSENFPRLQKKFPIAILGSSAIVGRDCRVPVLSGDIVRRGLYLYYWVGGWNSFYRFLGVKK